MEIKKLTGKVSVSAQITAADTARIKEAGFKAIICNRPDNEGPDQTSFAEIEKAAKIVGLIAAYVPAAAGMVTDADVALFGKALKEMPGPVLGYCRSGTRSATLWSLHEAQKRPILEILAATKAAGYDMNSIARRIANGGKTPTDTGSTKFDVVIVGVDAGGISTAASLLSRKSNLSIAIIDPSDMHDEQHGQTIVGGDIFEARETAKKNALLIPPGVKLIKSAVAAFEPKNNAIILDGCVVVTYGRLVIAPGFKLDWGAVEGLEDTLGRNGVTSNYQDDLVPYTWQLVQEMKEGRALFTQPQMPVKSAGAPQKALHLSGDAWLRRGVLKDIDIQFMNAGGVLLGADEYVPALMKYDVTLTLFHTLTSVDGAAKKATFKIAKPGAEPSETTVDFDMMHVCPPQVTPDFVRVSPLADAAGWVNVDQETLRHETYDNIWFLGDVMNTPNSKTAAAIRKQALTVAQSILSDINGKSTVAQNDGPGSSPLAFATGKEWLAMTENISVRAK